MIKEGIIEEGPVKMVTPIQCERKPAGSSEPFRFVHDLRNVNDALPTQRIRMEGIKELLQSIQIGDWMITWDLEAGYHQGSSGKGKQSLALVSIGKEKHTILLAFHLG